MLWQRMSPHASKTSRANRGGDGLGTMSEGLEQAYNLGRSTGGRVLSDRSLPRIGKQDMCTDKRVFW